MARFDLATTTLSRPHGGLGVLVRGDAVLAVAVCGNVVRFAASEGRRGGPR